jgi:mevalonate kinase
MEWPNFRTSVCGKWVLSGEHSVLKGVKAIVLPYAEIGLSLTFESGGSNLQVLPRDAQSLVFELLDVCAKSTPGIPFQFPKGLLTLESAIPMGAGLGSSAAFCVALTRWLAEPLRLNDSDICGFATRLENQFHGVSSGMDIAAIAAGQAISYIQGQGSRILGIRRFPKFTLHDTELRSKTSECVGHVQEFRKRYPSEGKLLDRQMEQASQWAEEGLIHYSEGKLELGLDLIQKSMLQSYSCFSSWGLVPTAADTLARDLYAQGALAVRMTGAGRGGMMVALQKGIR